MPRERGCALRIRGVPGPSDVSRKDSQASAVGTRCAHPEPMVRVCSARLALLVALTGCALGCSTEVGPDSEGGCGIAGCAAPADTLSYSLGAVETDAGPAIQLLHTPKGTLVGRGTRHLLVFAADGDVHVRRLAQDEQTARGPDGVALESFATRWEWPSRALTIIAQAREPNLEIRRTGPQGTTTYLCEARPADSVVCAPVK